MSHVTQLGSVDIYLDDVQIWYMRGITGLS